MFVIVNLPLYSQHKLFKVEKISKGQVAMLMVNPLLINSVASAPSLSFASLVMSNFSEVMKVSISRKKV